MSVRRTLALAILPSLLLLAVLQASAAPSVSAVGGADRWSAIVSRDWLPRSQAALQALQRLAQERYKVVLSDEQLRFVLRATPKAALPEAFADLAKGPHVLPIEAGLDEAQLRNRALLAPLRQVLVLVLDQLSQGHRERLPAWLVTGWTEAVAQEVVASLSLPELPSYLPDELLPPRKRGWSAVATLQNHRGPDFEARMAAYLAASSKPGFDATASFKEQFGVTETELLQRVDSALAGSGGGAVSPQGQPVALVLQQDGNAEVRAALTAFMAAEKPRALAFGRNQRWGIGAKSLRPMDAALDACRSHGGGDCRILALDDNIVPDPSHAYVMVQMGGYVNDAFTTEVQEQWLGLVRSSTLQFDRLVNEVLKVQLGRDVRVYVGAGAEDYERILTDDMNVRAATAGLQAEATGGLSNSHGQIALKFTAELKRPALFERAVKTPLHELTHELQKQLAEGYSGFRPPTWLIEGSADLFAATLARNLQIADGEAEALRDWRLRNLGWWRQGNRTNLQPDDIDSISGESWLRMTKDRRGNYQLAGLMTMYLQATLGERFFPAWVEYSRSAGHTKRSGHAFEQAFGIEQRAFLDDFKLWLAQQ